MIQIIKEYLATWALMRLEKQIMKWQKKLKQAHSKYYEKTGQWTPNDEDF
jgi:hypothetical protein